jgi:tRNA G18 (ribose-2'-O)-methylase SpoU
MELVMKRLENIDTFLEIPQLGTKHSLNVSVCGGIVIWEFAKNLGLKNKKTANTKKCRSLK